MGFTTSCFIRKNTSQLQNKLADIGYKFTCFPFGDALVTENERSLAYIEKLSNVPYYGIEEDCGTNEELFLAIAALRDDSDVYQYFVNEKGMFVFCNQSELKHVIDNSEDWWDYSVSEFHKATVAELIEHFK